MIADTCFHSFVSNLELEIVQVRDFSSACALKYFSFQVPSYLSRRYPLSRFTHPVRRSCLTIKYKNTFRTWSSERDLARFQTWRRTTSVSKRLIEYRYIAFYINEI